MIIAALLFAALLAAGYALGYLPLALVVGYAVLSGITFILYGLDKRAAVRAAQRTPELRLQTLALLGGWPGALLGQELFRHKRRKLSFMIGFWLVTLLNVALLLGWLAWRNDLLHLYSAAG